MNQRGSPGGRPHNGVIYNSCLDTHCIIKSVKLNTHTLTNLKGTHYVAMLCICVQLRPAWIYTPKLVLETRNGHFTRGNSTHVNTYLGGAIIGLYEAPNGAGRCWRFSHNCFWVFFCSGIMFLYFFWPVCLMRSIKSLWCKQISFFVSALKRLWQLDK